MPKSLVLGNGNILVGLDHSAQVKDFYFPFVGLENHVGSYANHRVGIWLDNKLSWLGDSDWIMSIDYQFETLVSNIVATNQKLSIEIRFLDVVYNESNIFVRKVFIKNLAKNSRTIKIFFSQQFVISEARRGSTAYYDPDTETIIHYKGERAFLVAAMSDNKSFDDYSIGLFSIEGKEGTWRDAEDGVLSKNPIEHGSVDSTIGFSLTIDALETTTVYYWIAAGKKIKEVKDLHQYVLNKSPEHLIESTNDFWFAWVNKLNFSFYGLDKKVISLFKKSLLIIRTHVDSEGAIIASGDSDMLQYGRDTYSYMWPRDASLIVLALDKAGYPDITRRFFKFCNSVIESDGYLLHKYRADRSLGASWHPWVQDGKKQLPIQEDETALVLYSLWQHYKTSKDLEFVESVYNSLIKKSAEFLYRYRDEKTKLPLASYDLWEEKRGVTAFTSGAVYGGLKAAESFATLLGKERDSKKYAMAADEIKKAILDYFYDEKNGLFYKLLNSIDGKIVYDHTVDASTFYGLFKFGILEVTDERLTKFFQQIKKRLFCQTVIGGVARYEGDKYYQINSNTPGNPWFIATFWFLQYHIEKAKKESDMEVVRKQLLWTVDRALPSGILSEQINPYTGEQLSATPLIWSHSEFVLTVIRYLEKLEELGICKVCNEVKSL